MTCANRLKLVVQLGRFVVPEESRRPNLATRWREDRSVRRKPKGAKNLALLRGAILALLPQETFSSLNAAFDHSPENRAEAIRLLTQTPPHCP